MKRFFLALMLMLMVSVSGAALNVSGLIVLEPSDVSKSAAYTGTAGSTGTWVAGPRAVLVFCTSDCTVKVGEGVTATATDTAVPAYTAIWMPVAPGTGAAWRVSAIQISAAGTVYATPFN